MREDLPTTPPVEHNHYDRLEQLEFEEQWRANRRRHWIFDIILSLVVIALAVGAWFAFPILKRDSQQYSRYPEVQKHVNSIEDGLKAAGSKFDEWVSGQQSFRDRSEKSLRELRARLDAMETNAGQATVAMVMRVESELAPQLDRLQAEYEEIRNARNADKDQIASFEQQLRDLRAQTDQQAKLLADAQNKIQAQDDLIQKQITDVADIHQTQQRNRQDFDALNSKLSTEQITFEVSKDRQTDIAPGYALSITGIDTSYHRVNGWLWIGSDRNTIWLRGQSTQQPLEFYTKDGDKHELVITKLTEDSAAGYLVQPKPAGITAISPAGD